MKDKKVATIIPTYNNVYDTLKAANSVILSHYSSKIIVVDDASENDIFEKLQRTLNNLSKEIILLRNDENRGFAASCNLGADFAINEDFEILFFLNNDAVVKADAIGYMVAEFDNSNVAIVGPKIYLNRSNTLNSVGGYFDKSTLLKKEYGCMVEDFGQFDKRREVEFVMGSAFMVLAKLYQKMKGMDEKFYMYTEETDLCYRVINSGFKIIYQPSAVVWHEHGKTMGAFNNRIMYYWIRNGILFGKKNGSIWNVINMIFYFHKTHLKGIIKKMIKSFLVFNIAIFDGMIGHTGKRKLKLIDKNEK